MHQRRLHDSYPWSRAWTARNLRPACFLSRSLTPPARLSPFVSSARAPFVLAYTQASGALRQQYVEPRHLAKQYTCIAWHRPSSKVSSSAETVERVSQRRIKTFLQQSYVPDATAAACFHFYALTDTTCFCVRVSQPKVPQQQ